MNIVNDTVKTNFLTENAVVLDIETTGVSRIHNYIQIAGILTSDKSNNLIQWQIDSVEEEKDLLLSLCKQLENKEIYSFNGLHFDIPFINARLNHYGLKEIEISDHHDLYLSLLKNRYYLKHKSYALQSLELDLNLARFEKFEQKDDQLLYKDITDPQTANILVHNKYDLINTELLIDYLRKVEKKKIFSLVNVDKKNTFKIKKITLNKNVCSVHLNSSKKMIRARYEDKNYLLDSHKQQIIIKFMVVEGYIEENQLGYVHTQADQTILKDLSDYQLPKPHLLIYSEKQLELENIKVLLKKILSKYS